jgi:hypothetical protein
MSELQENYRVVANAFPTIGEKIKLFWGHQDFTDLMHDLLHSTRDHSRGGFKLDVALAFLELQALHDRVFPQFKKVSFDARTLIHRTAYS